MAERGTRRSSAPRKGSRMILLDSNIIIYSVLPEHGFLRDQMRGQSLAVTMISRIEVLGFHRLTVEHAHNLKIILDFAAMVPMSIAIMNAAIQLRQQRRMNLGDAIVAATALEHDMVLWTRNVKDFYWITNLMVHDPFGVRLNINDI
ncbi:MAG: type II toxin-antitoxin system VapC family toxin [Magnetococcus sp. YQC-5]